MKIKAGSIVTEMTGKLGGHTFEQSASGLRLSTKSTHRAKPSQRQMQARFFMKRCAQRWRVLSTNQRRTWLGASMEGLSGFDLYKRVNFLRLKAGLSMAATYADGPKPPALSTFTISATRTPFVFRINMPFAVVSPYAIRIQASGPLPASSQNTTGKLITMFFFVGTGASQYFINNQWLSRYGTMPVGAKVFVNVQVLNINSGQSGSQLVKSVTF